MLKYIDYSGLLRYTSTNKQEWMTWGKIFPIVVLVLFIHGCAGPPRFRTMVDETTLRENGLFERTDDFVYTGKFSWPMDVREGYRITSLFGEPREGGRKHCGIDIALNRGDEVLSAAGGIVVFSGDRGNAGLTVEIKHGRGWSTVYAHNEMLLCRNGDKVRKGEVIALAGDSGNAKGVHLHFEIRHEGKSVDPLLYLPPYTW